MNRMLRFRTEDAANFEAIKDGRKSVETRAATVRYANIKPRDSLTIVCGDQRIERAVTKVRKFKNPHDLFAYYSFKQVMPDASSEGEAVEVYGSYPAYKEKIRKHGLIALEMKNG